MRKFTGEELSQEDVVALLKAALMAPTSKRSNSWQFIALPRIKRESSGSVLTEVLWY